MAFIDYGLAHDETKTGGEKERRRTSTAGRRGVRSVSWWPNRADLHIHHIFNLRRKRKGHLGLQFEWIILICTITIYSDNFNALDAQRERWAGILLSSSFLSWSTNFGWLLNPSQFSKIKPLSAIQSAMTDSYFFSWYLICERFNVESLGNRLIFLHEKP